MSLSVTVRGRTPPRFMFVHGFGDGKFIWDHVMPSVLPYGGAIALDLRGHGESTHALDCNYGTRDHVEDVRAVLGALCPHPIVAIGHSLGAEIVMYLAGTADPRIDSAVLVDGGPDTNPHARDHMQKEFSRQSWDYPSLPDYENHLVRRLPLADRDLLSAIAARAVARCGDGYRLRCDPHLRYSATSLDAGTLWGAFRSIQCPVLVIRGGGSAYLSAEAAIRMKHEGHRCEVETVKVAGHAVMLDNPQGFSAALVGWIRRMPPASYSSAPR